VAWAKLRSLVAGLIRRGRVEADMADEIEFHIETRARDLVARGMSLEAATRTARIEFGSVERYKEEVRGARGLRLTDELTSDVLGGMRALPSSDWSAAPDATPPLAARWTPLTEPVAHVFTHFSLALTVHVAHVERHSMPPGEGEWWPLARIGEAGLPTLFRRAAEAAMKERKPDAH